MKGPLIRLNSKLPDSVLCLCLSVLGFLALWSLLMILQPISAADCILMWLRGSCLPMCRNTFVLIRQNTMWYYSKKTLHTRFITGKKKQKTLKLDAEILSSTCFFLLKNESEVELSDKQEVKHVSVEAWINISNENGEEHSMILGRMDRKVTLLYPKEWLILVFKK